MVDVYLGGRFRRLVEGGILLRIGPLGLEKIMIEQKFFMNNVVMTLVM